MEFVLSDINVDQMIHLFLLDLLIFQSVYSVHCTTTLLRLSHEAIIILIIASWVVLMNINVGLIIQLFLLYLLIFQSVYDNVTEGVISDIKNVER